MSYMIEIVITAFTFGGIIGAIIALHLSSHLKETTISSLSKSLSDLKHAPAKIKSKADRRQQK